MKHDQALNEAVQVLNLIKDLLENQLIGVCLNGSAVTSGLRLNSDVDNLVLTLSSLSQCTTSDLTKRLMQTSGIPGKPNTGKPLEVTVASLKDVVPWRFTPPQASRIRLVFSLASFMA